MFWFEPTEIPEDAWMAGGSMRGLRFLLGFSVEILREGDDGRDDGGLPVDARRGPRDRAEEQPDPRRSDPQRRHSHGPAGERPAPNLWQARFTGSIECQSNFY
jgi:hypothetical protein